MEDCIAEPNAVPGDTEPNAVPGNDIRHYLIGYVDQPIKPEEIQFLLTQQRT